MDSKLIIGFVLGAAAIGLSIPLWGDSDHFFISGATLQNLYCHIAVAGQNTVDCDNPSDTFTLVEGDGITITTDNSTDTITFNATGGGGGGGDNLGNHIATQDLDLREFSLVSNQSNSAAIDKTVGRLAMYYNDDTNGAEYGGLIFHLISNGAFPSNGLEIDSLDDSGYTMQTYLYGAANGNSNIALFLDGSTSLAKFAYPIEIDRLTDGELTFLNSNSNSNGDPVGAINFKGKNDNGDYVDYFRLSTEIADPTAGAEAGIVHFQVQDYDGSLQDFIEYNDFTGGSQNGLFLDGLYADVNIRNSKSSNSNINILPDKKLSDNYIHWYGLDDDSNQQILANIRVSNSVSDPDSFTNTLTFELGTGGGFPDSPLYMTSQIHTIFIGGYDLDFGTADLTNIILGTTTGSQIGTSSSQKLAFHGATPTDQFDNIPDPSGGLVQDSEARDAVDAILDLLEEKGLMAGP